MKKTEKEQAMKLIRFLESENETLRMNNNLLRMDINTEARIIAEEYCHKTVDRMESEIADLKSEIADLKNKLKMARQTKKQNSEINTKKVKKVADHALHLLPEIIKSQDEIIEKCKDELTRLNSPIIKHLFNH